LWNTSNRKETGQLAWEGKESVESLAFSPDGKFFAAGGDDGTVKVWEVGAWKERWSAKNHKAAIRCLTFSFDSKNLASCCRNRKMRAGLSGDTDVKVWDMSTEEVAFQRRQSESECQTIRFTRDGKNLVIGYLRGTIRIVKMVADRKDDKEIATGLNMLFCVAISPDGRKLAAGGQSSEDGHGIVKLYELSSRKELVTLRGKDFPILAIEFSPNGESVAGCSFSSKGSIELWDLSQAKP